MASSIRSELPPFDISGSLQTRSKVRTGWERDFETHYTEFANAIALGLLTRTIEKFNKHLKDPYRKGFDADGKYLTSFSLDITNLSKKRAERLKMIAGTTAEAPPFKEWIERLAAEQNPEPFARRKRIKELDKQHFQELMALVGRAAADKIRTLLTEHVSRQAHENVHFHVEWYRQAEKLLSNPSNFTDNCINIQLWLDQRTTISSSTASASPQVISQYRTQAAEIKRKQTRNNILMFAVAAVVIGLFLLMASKTRQQGQFD
ncbi:MAG: hypothetical protein K2P51_02235 [Rhabdochlamydiaceae bacterium]|nr:hypothetical protein [Rhabdochlamydiaceae bacterium]